MQFTNYYHAREHFQRHKYDFKEDQLKSLAVDINTYYNKTDKMRHKVKLANLLLDIEHQIDLCQDSRILMSDIMKEKAKHPPVKLMAKDSVVEIDKKFFSIQLKNGVEEELGLLAKIQREVILGLMEKYDNKTKCARLLGITVKTLYNRLDEYKNMG